LAFRSLKVAEHSGDGRKPSAVSDGTTLLFGIVVRASNFNDTLYESEITTASLRLNSRFDAESNRQMRLAYTPGGQSKITFLLQHEGASSRGGQQISSQ
jgi:hypothetical protein